VSKAYEPCPQCLDYAIFPEWGGVTEYRGGYSEQTCTITCSACSFGISITVMVEKMKPGQVRIIEEELKNTWNRLSHQMRNR
jgi:hypothetical protein